MANNALSNQQIFTEPNWLIPNFANIPAELQQLPWAVWKAEPRLDESGKQTGKWNKAPLSPLTGRNIPTNQPNKFGTYQEAMTAFATGKYTGVGILLTGSGITGFDIDNLHELSQERPEIKEWVIAALKNKVYCEKSPSNTGIRLFIHGQLNSKGRKHHGLEIYDNVRFLTITGHTLKPIPNNYSLPTTQHLIDSFLKMLPEESRSLGGIGYLSPYEGSIDISQLNDEIKSKLPEIFNRKPIENDIYEKLFFAGDISMHGEDRSGADWGLINYLIEKGLNPQQVDMVFRASGLYREKWDEARGPQTYGEGTIQNAIEKKGVKASNDSLFKTSEKVATSQFQFLDPSSYRPVYAPNGMPPRRFVGPKICEGVRLFPEKALSSMVALGAVGKTSVLLSIACHIAAGTEWNGYSVEKQKVALFFCEETQEEISRKFSAITDGWNELDRHEAESNLITIPLLGVDARLTSINRNQYQSSEITEKLIDLLKKFDLKDGLVILDHMQGFTAGDLNSSETATAICREANKIVDATGAAVVMAAHIGKQNIKAKEVEQGFAVGSLAFENATRQMSGMIPMPPEEAKKYGLEATRKDYVRLSIPKNSYGAPDSVVWLHKVFSAKYHTVTFKPVTLTKPMPVAKLTELQKVQVSIFEYLSKNLNITRNQLEKVSGIKGPLKASKATIREALDGLISTGKVRVGKVSELERAALNLPKQVKDILRISTTKDANKTAEFKQDEIPMADINPLHDWDL